MKEFEFIVYEDTVGVIRVKAKDLEDAEYQVNSILEEHGIREDLTCCDLGFDVTKSKVTSRETGALLKDRGKK